MGNSFDDPFADPQCLTHPERPFVSDFTSGEVWSETAKVITGSTWRVVQIDAPDGAALHVKAAQEEQATYAREFA